MWRYPEYKDFSVKSLGTDKNSEKVKINWAEHLNEPRKNRVVKVHPLSGGETGFAKPIPDDQKPPITLSLGPVEKAEPWIAQIDLVQGRFQMSHAQEDVGTPQAQWMRTPPDWCDWLEWSFSPIEECICNFSSNEEFMNLVTAQSMPWSHFLHLFHLGEKQKLHQSLKDILGPKNLEIALPFTKGSTWEVIEGSTTVFTCKIISSSVTGLIDLQKCFEGCSPSKWCSIPSEIRIELEMQQDSIYLGKKGTIWNLRQSSGERNPLMISPSGENLEIDYWIWNAIGEANKGYIRARMPLEKLWYNPPSLFFMDDNKKRDMNLRTEYGKNIFDGLSASVKADEETNENALFLLNRWQEWAGSPNVRPHFREMIRRRAASASAEAVSGALAFMARLMAVGQEESVFIPGLEHALSINNMESIVIDTFEYVKKYFREPFLRDLLLSEILISWYWDKTIASI